MDTKELKKLVEFLRKSGVKTYKTAEIELELLPTPPKRDYRRKGTDEQPAPNYTQDDILFWSSGTLPGA